jgi:hypothetical protein
VNVGRVGAAILDDSQVVVGERGLEAHGGITVHAYVMAAISRSPRACSRMRKIIVGSAIFGPCKNAQTVSPLLTYPGIRLPSYVGTEASMRVLQHKKSLRVMRRVPIEGGPRRGNASAMAKSPSAE